MYDTPTANERPNDKRYFHRNVLTPARREILADPEVRATLRAQTLLKAGDPTLREIPVAVAEAVATATAERQAAQASQPKGGLFSVTNIVIVGGIGVALFFVLR